MQTAGSSVVDALCSVCTAAASPLKCKKCRCGLLKAHKWDADPSLSQGSKCAVNGISIVVSSVYVRTSDFPNLQFSSCVLN